MHRRMSDRFINRAHHLAKEMRVQTTPADRDPVLMAVADGLHRRWWHFLPVGVRDEFRADCDAIYAALLSERHRAEEAKWLPIDSAPKDGTRVLLKVRPWAYFGDATETATVGTWLDNSLTTAAWKGWLTKEFGPFRLAYGWQPLPLTPEPTHER